MSTAKICRLVDDDSREILKRSCYKFPQRARFFYKEFIKLTEYSNLDSTINITRLLNKYNITSAELFYTMYTLSSPFGMGQIAHDKENDIFTIAEAETILQERHFYLDYYNGKPIKNWFRKDRSEQQTINLKKFDDRTYPGCFYDCILSLINYKYSTQEIEEL